MAVEAVGDVVLRKLKDLLIHDSIAFYNVTDQIEEIRIQLRHMRGYLVDAERSDDRYVVDWATEYLRLLFSAEDKIENYVLSLAARGRRNIGFFQRHGFTLFAAAYDCFGPGKLLRPDLDDLAKEIEKLELKRPDQVVDASLRGGNPNPEEQGAEQGICKQMHPDPVRSLSLVRRESFRFGSPLSSPGRHRRHPKLATTYPDHEGLTLIGFSNHLSLLVDRLLLVDNQGEGIIPLVGPAGSGKTTLVETVYNLWKIKTRFNCRAWVRLPDGSIKPPQLLASLLQQVLKSKEGGGTANLKLLISRVRDSLENRTYLIVLDHVSEVQVWNTMKSAFPNLGVGDSKSKVIIITRDQDVATGISEQENCKPHCLDELCDEHSWKLLNKEFCVDQERSEIENGFRDNILKICKGRPLDIVLLGGLLSTKGQSYEEWKWYLSQASWCRMTDILQLSYNDLPAHSKLCLLYMALFPNEADISVRRLHRLWHAEGFMRQSPGISEEDTVEACFDDLVRRNFIKISKLRSDGSPRRCRLPRALREYLSPKAHQISLFYIHQEIQESVSSASVSTKGEEPQSKLPVRRVIEYVDIKSYSPASSPSYENLKSYLSFNFQSNDTQAKGVGNFISKIIGSKCFGMLRVLDLEGVYKPTLPETLNLLFHLRYLSLRWTFIDHLPQSVGDLPYLETLDLKRTYIDCLPRSIWKLKHLRHLNLPGIPLDYKQKKCHTSLTELRTLIGLIVDDEAIVKHELSKLRELRELGITCQSIFSKELMDWIQKLTNLRSLWLKSKDEMGRPSVIKLEPLSNLSVLSHLSLLGNISSSETFPISPNKFPPNLKVLALSVSQLSVDPMSILSKLPHLSVLRLLADSYLGTHMNCPRNGFKKLRVLKLWMLKELVEWTVEEGGMPQIKELNIRHCQMLKQLPSQLLSQNSLEELTLTSMPREFVKQVEDQKQSHTTLNVHNYEFTPLPWEKDPDLWN